MTDLKSKGWIVAKGVMFLAIAATTATLILIEAPSVAAAPGDESGKGSRVTVRVVRLGSDRFSGEGLRIGTVRRPPRGVPKSDYSSRNFYDVWLPTLAPSAEMVKAAQAQTKADWGRSMKVSRRDGPAREQGDARSLAALHHADFSRLR
jgi:uncharacterized protein YeaO (DUF488 family)